MGLCSLVEHFEGLAGANPPQVHWQFPGEGMGVSHTPLGLAKRAYVAASDCPQSHITVQAGGDNEAETFHVLQTNDALQVTPPGAEEGRRGKGDAPAIHHLGMRLGR